jgi:hypothetical protein
MPASSDNYYQKVIQNYDVEQSQYKFLLYTVSYLIQEGFSLDKETPNTLGL